mmetsp:Transcript_65064/g.172317  ORF Transcript_65064/g.172317 Transcript_65064/m.172317 type:complete len:147 (-) Transcript_65064:515-955(-)
MGDPTREVQVVSHHLVRGAHGSVYVQYLIRVIEGEHQFEVNRRFSEFVALHEHLSRDTSVALPRLPPKFTCLGMVDPRGHWFRERRRVLLQQYLNDLLVVVPDMEVTAIKEFFDHAALRLGMTSLSNKLRSSTCSLSSLPEERSIF